MSDLWTQDNFAAGMRRNCSKFVPGQMERIIGAWCHRGDLEMMPKPAAISFDGLFTNDRGEETIRSLDRYIDAEGRMCLLARLDTSLWIAIPNIDFDRPSEDTDPQVLAMWDMKDGTDYVDDVHYNDEGATTQPLFRLDNYGTMAQQLWSGRVRAFNGSSHLQSIRDAYQLFWADASPICYEVWIRCTGPKGVPYSIVSTIGPTPDFAGYVLRIDTSGNLYAEICEDKAADKWVGRAGTTDLCDGEWHHVAFTWDGSHYPDIYVDGVNDDPEDAGIAGTEGAWDSDNIYDFYVGGAYNATDNHERFIGQMGTLSFYYINANLTAAKALSHYEAEAPRYGDPVAVTYSWFPLHGGSHIGDSKTYQSATYLRERSSICGETFRQREANLFCASDKPGVMDYLLIWRGTILRRGYVRWWDATNGGNFELFGGTSGDFPCYSWKGSEDISHVLPGDTLYIKDHSGAVPTWRLHGHVIKWARYNEIVVHDAGWDTTGKGPGGSDYCEYCIVRLHRPGVEPAGACVGVKNTGGGTFVAGQSVVYVWRYVNTLTGYLGKFSAPCTAVEPDTDDTIYVSGWDEYPADQAANGLQVYRQIDGGAFYLVHEETLVVFDDPAGLGGTKYWNRDALSVTWNDTNVADGEQHTDEAIGYYDRPGALSYVGYYDHQLWAVAQNRMWKSALDPFYEYWSPEDCLIPALPAAENQGGTFLVGASVTDPITGWVVEGGGFAMTGEEGSNLLVFTATHAHRIFGHSRSTFSLVSAFGVGSINHRGIVNGGGVSFWCDGDKFYRVGTGLVDPEEISDALWPYGMRAAWISDELSELVAARYWNGFYIWSADFSAAGESALTFCYNVAARSWVAYAHHFRDFVVWDKPGDSAAKVITGASEDLVTYTGGVAELWPTDGTLGSLDLLTGHIFPSKMNESELLHHRLIDRLQIISRKPVAANTTLAVTPYVNGDTVNAAATAESAIVAYEASATGARVLSEVGQPKTGGWLIQIGISATNQPLLRIEGLQATIETRGKA